MAKVSEKKIASAEMEELEELEGCYQKYSALADQAKAEYEEAYRKIVENLSPHHLEPFATILLEHEKCVLQNTEGLIAELKENLLKSLRNTLNIFWEEYAVSNRIALLEMLKDKFKGYKDRNWDMIKKTPEERTMPFRMRFKEMCLRNLQKQLQFQSTELEGIMKKNSSQRERIDDIEQKRIYLKELMARNSESIKQEKPILMQMALDLLDSSTAGDGDGDGDEEKEQAPQHIIHVNESDEIL